MDVPIETRLLNQGLKIAALRPLANDEAPEAHLAGQEFGAGTHQECMVLHQMQPSYGQQRKGNILFCDWSLTSFEHAHTEAHDLDLSRLDIRKVLQDVLPIEFRNGEAKSALLQLRIEMSRMQQQIRSVERHAKRQAEKASRGQCNP